VHDDCLLDVAVGEHDLVDAAFAANVRQVCFIENRYPVWVALSRQSDWIVPSGNARYLGRSERDYLAGGVVAKDGVEIVEIAASRTHDEHPLGFLFGRHGS
jgi:hypothetical protein